MPKFFPKNLIKIFSKFIYYFLFSISYGQKCEDKNAPGRPSDCPKLKYLCDRPLYKDLMSRECPR